MNTKKTLNNKMLHRIVMFFVVVGMGAASLTLVLITSSGMASAVGAEQQSAILGAINNKPTGEQLKLYSQAQVYFYSPGDCLSSNSRFSSVCGSTPKEKYWSFLRKYFDEVHAAAILGNIDNEGSYGPTRWEIGLVVEQDGGPFIRSWDSLYNCQPCGVGVGALGITWNLGNYLHYINDNFPESIKYFQDAKYSEPGDKARELIGDAGFNVLVEAELSYMLEDSAAIHDGFNAITDVREAAKYWAEEYERCDGCLASQGMTSTKTSRMNDAERDYNEMKNFTCSANTVANSTIGDDSVNVDTSSVATSITSVVSGNDITWIGDSDSALAADENGNRLIDVVFPGADYGPSFNNPSSYVQSCKFVDSDGCGDSPNRSGLEILEQIVKQNDLRQYLVFALGGNGGWTQDMMDKFLQLVGDDTTVILTTTKYKSGMDFTNSNEIIKKAASEHDNIYVADVAANYKDEYFDDSGIEFNVDGAKMWIQTIAEALDKAKSSSDSCTTFSGEYPDYVQFDSRWGGLPYDNGTFKNSACGATSMAAIATMTSGQDVFPTDIADLLNTHKKDLGQQRFYSSGYMRVLDPIVCEKYGCDVEVIEVGSAGENLANIRKYLSNGWMIHASGDCDDGTDSGHGPTCPYSRNGHYVAALALKDNDTAIVDEPGWDGLTEYKLVDLASGAGAITAVRANGKGGNGGSCANYCKNETSSVSGGLTEEQAQKLADYYNGPDVDPSTLVLGRKDNCTSFSVWFESELTDLTPYSDNGKEVAHGLAVQNNLTEGTEPRPFAVFGITRGITMCEDGNLCGHTGIVVAVNGDKIITVEAAYNAHDAWVITDHDRSYFENTKYGNSFTYMDEHIDKTKLSKIVGSF